MAAGLLLTPLIAQYLLHTSLPLALGVYALVCLGCVACLRALPIETVGRSMPSSMGELVHSLQASSGGGFASDIRAPTVWRWLRWPAQVDGYDVKASSHGNARRGGGEPSSSGAETMLASAAP